MDSGPSHEAPCSPAQAESRVSPGRRAVPEMPSRSLQKTRRLQKCQRGMPGDAERRARRLTQKLQKLAGDSEIACSPGKCRPSHGGSGLLSLGFLELRAWDSAQRRCGLPCPPAAYNPRPRGQGWAEVIQTAWAFWDWSSCRSPTSLAGGAAEGSEGSSWSRAAAQWPSMELLPWVGGGR